MKSHALFSSFFACLVVLALWVPPAGAYPRYSQGKVTNPDGAQEAFGNCKTCHGGFRDADYISPADGRRWLEIYQEVEADAPEEEPGLHDIHRHIMLDKIGRSRCNVCHLSTGRYPVVLNSSATSDLEPVSCMGCHGRNEDEGNDSISAGLGAGLRQHHTRARVKECMTCHADANPARYEPVGEDVLPPYYAAPNDVFVNKPTDLCNQRGDEDYAGGPKGLDNDGDGRYDKSDLDCEPIGAGENNSGL